MNIILFGPPGAGKGTQADNLKKKFNLFKISSGDLLREEIKRKSVLGNKVESELNQGLLVPDAIINELIEDVASKEKYFDRLIFDGYPRNLNQAQNLDNLLKKHKQKISCVLSLKVNEDVIIKRVLGRQVCSKCGLTFNEFFNPPKKENYNCELKYLQKRSDDNEKTIRNRYKTYVNTTLVILNYYRNQNLLYEINGMKHIEAIYEEICSIINTLGT